MTIEPCKIDSFHAISANTMLVLQTLYILDNCLSTHHSFCSFNNTQFMYNKKINNVSLYTDILNSPYCTASL